MALARLLLAGAFLLSMPGALHAKEKERNPWLLTVSSNHGSWTSDKFSADGSQSVGFLQLAYDLETMGALPSPPLTPAPRIRRLGRTGGSISTRSRTRTSPRSTWPSSAI
ncbi:MAG: hypothetical protein HQK85_03805 [Nitrospinae bacterium]|nr:hypothetical protein [Nitrospinota bacterium]